MSAVRRRPGSVSKEDWQAVNSPPLDDAALARMRPAENVLPALVAGYRRSRGRPKTDHPKTLVSLRLDAEVVRAFKAEGPGWQTRINGVLARWAKRRKKAA